MRSTKYCSPPTPSCGETIGRSSLVSLVSGARRLVSVLAMGLSFASCSKSDESSTASCLSMGIETPAYPGTYTITEAELVEFEERAEEFRQTYRDQGVDMSAYRIVPRAATSTPYIEWNPTPDGPGISVADEQFDIDNAVAVFSAFYDRWSEFFNPYGADLVRGDRSSEPGYAAGVYCEPYLVLPEGDPAVDGQRCFALYLQQVCGVKLSNRGPHEYNGGIDIFVDTRPPAPPSLGWVQSSVVPSVPLPWAEAPTSAQVDELVDGLEIVQSCTGPQTLGSQSCVQKIDGPMILVEPVGETSTATTIEYRIVVYADVAPNCEEGDEFTRVTVEIDAIEGEVRRWWDTAGCDS